MCFSTTPSAPAANKASTTAGIRYSEVHDDHRRLQTIGPFNQRAGVGHREDRVERRLQQAAHALQVTSVPVCE
jgi:hypothetical protein